MLGGSEVLKPLDLSEDGEEIFVNGDASMHGICGAISQGKSILTSRPAYTTPESSIPNR
jgi:hypothetical protein